MAVEGEVTTVVAEEETVIPTGEVETPGQQPDLTADQLVAIEGGAEPAAEEGETPESVKEFTQEQFEAELGKRVARKERQMKRELTTPEPTPLQIESSLKSEDFGTTEEYIEALVTERTDATIAHRDAAAQTSTVEEGYLERVEVAIDKYPDFEQIVNNPNLRITGEMAETIKSSDQGPELAYYLGSNPEEALRISKLTPLTQARELGKLEGTLDAAPTKPATTKVPEPITPVHGKVSAAPVLDTTDPRSVSSMSATEWINADRKRRAGIFATKGYK